MDKLSSAGDARAIISRIWKIVVHQDASMAAYSDVDHLMSEQPLKIAHFENGTAGIDPADFYISVSFDARPMSKTHPSRTRTAGRVKYQAAINVELNELGSMDDFPGYGELLKGTVEPERRELRMAHSLYHELIHAGLIFEGLPEWPMNYRGGLRRRYDQFMLDAASGVLADSRNKMQDAIRQISALSGKPIDFKYQLEEWLNELFVAQESFSRFGVTVSNKQFAHAFAGAIDRHTKYSVSESLRAQRETRNKALERELLKFLNQIEKIHRPGGQVSQPKPSPWHWSKGRLEPYGIRDRPNLEYVPRDAYSPSRSPWPTGRPFNVNPAFGVGIHNPLLHPFTAPTHPFQPAPIPKPWQPTMPPAPHPFVQPVAIPKPWHPPVMPNWNLGRPTVPGTPSFAVGPIRATSAPPPWQRSRPYEAKPGTGGGWNPNRFGFNDVTHMTLPIYHPDRPIYVPTSYGAPGRMVGVIDHLSRD